MTSPDFGTTHDYRLLVEYGDGVEHEQDDPYRFAPTLGEIDRHLINEGRHEQLWTVLGAHVRHYPGPLGDVWGVSFAVWAPRAKAVHVIGDFNDWDRRSHPMRALGESGIWELFLPGAQEGMNYQFAVRGPDELVRLKSDPMARMTEVAPKQAAIVTETHYEWRDDDWMEHRRTSNAHQGPMSIYEVHLGSWRQEPRLPRARRAPRQLRARPRLHPRRVPPGHGAPVRPVVGLPRHRLLRAELTVGPSRRLPLPRRRAAPGRHRGPARLGARALRHRRVGPRPLRRPAALRAPGPPQGLAPRVGLQHLRLRPARGAQLPRRQRHLLARGVPPRRPARRRRGLDALPRLRPRRRGVGAQQGRRPREPRGRRAAQGDERHGLQAGRRHRHDRRGVDDVAGRHEADQPGRPRLRLQVEHGLDERLAEVPRRGAHLPQLPPRQADLLAHVRLRRELRAADQPRRGRPRQGLAAAQVARLARGAGRDAARLPRLPLVPPRQAAALHGLRVRPGVRVVRGPQPRLVAARAAAALPRAQPRQGPQRHLPRQPRAVGARRRPLGLRVARGRRRRPQHVLVAALRHGRPGDRRPGRRLRHELQRRDAAVLPDRPAARREVDGRARHRRLPPRRPEQHRYRRRGPRGGLAPAAVCRRPDRAAPVDRVARPRRRAHRAGPRRRDRSRDDAVTTTNGDPS